MLRKEDIISGVYGLAVGDALGVPVEFVQRGYLDMHPVRKMMEYGTHNQPKGTWSDDTSMVLATMDALCARGGSLGRIMDRFVKWVQNAEYTAGGKVFDIGGTTYNAIQNYLMGESIEHCGEDDEYSNGNGSLMRMLPVAYYVYFNYGVRINERAVDFIYNLSGLTHAHIVSKVSCVYYVYLAMYIMLEKEQRGLQPIVKEAIRAVEKFYGETMDTEIVFINGSLVNSVKLSRDDINSTGYVVDSLEASIWCLYNTYSYREAVEMAVNLGGDTDTIGAITGSLAGLYYGFSNIPKAWVDDLQNKELINSICNRFCEEYK